MILSASILKQRVSIDQLDTHLQKEPHKIPKADRRSIVKTVLAQWGDIVCHDEWELRDVHVPTPSTKAISQLLIERNGFQCKGIVARTTDGSIHDPSIDPVRPTRFRLTRKNTGGER
jgi:hypothetical protein